MTKAIRAILKKLIGQELKKVFASVHVFEKMMGGSSGSVWLFFDDMRPIRLSCASDGWHLQVDEVLPEPVDMGEAGEMVIRDRSQTTTFQDCLNRSLKKVWSIDFPVEGDTIGLRFDFGISYRPLVINWGDELFLSNYYPTDFETKEISEVLVGE